jgi:hypothetical protein
MEVCTIQLIECLTSTYYCELVATSWLAIITATGERNQNWFLF